MYMYIVLFIRNDLMLFLLQVYNCMRKPMFIPERVVL